MMEFIIQGFAKLRDPILLQKENWVWGKTNENIKGTPQIMSLIWEVEVLLLNKVACFVVHCVDITVVQLNPWKLKGIL